MLSAPSSTVDASLVPAAPTASGASASPAVPAAPFDTILNGLQPGSAAPAAAAAEGMDATATPTVPLTPWMLAAALLAEGEAPIETAPEEPVAPAAEDEEETEQELWLLEPMVPAASSPPVPVAPPAFAPSGAVTPTPAEEDVPNAGELPTEDPAALEADSGLDAPAPHVAASVRYRWQPTAMSDTPAASWETVSAATEEAGNVIPFADATDEGLPAGDPVDGNLAAVESAPDAALVSPDRHYRATPLHRIEAVDASLAAMPADPARIAASSAMAPEPLESDAGETVLKFAEALADKTLKPALQSLGIEPAKVRSTMEIVAPEISVAPSVDRPSEAESAFSAGAVRTMERVQATADLMQAGHRGGVNLRLDFGESGPLSVQITLRHGQLHTQFRSDSAEVRESLTQAWTQFVQRGEHGSLPLAEPVMMPLRNATPEAAPAGRFSDTFAQSDADGRPGREAHRRDESAGQFGRGLRRRAAAASPVSVPAASRGPGSSHLSVLA